MAASEQPPPIASSNDNPLAFDRIYMYGRIPGTLQPKNRSSSNTGKFKMAAGGVGWKDAVSGHVLTVRVEDMKLIQWTRGFHSGFQLSFEMAEEEKSLRCSFHGFSVDAKKQIEAFIAQNYPSVPFIDVSQQRDLKGGNSGTVSVDGESVLFSVAEDGSNDAEDARSLFTIPLHSVSNVAVSGRNELLIELQPISGAPCQVSEIRFHVQGKMAIESEEDDVNDEQAMEEELMKDQVDAVMALCEQVKAGSSIVDSVDEMIISFSDVPCQVPRGRYDVELGVGFMRLHGRSYNHRVPYSSILKLFLLPKADDYHVLFVMQLDPPLRHGQTKYPFLVFSIPKDEVIEVAPSASGDIVKEHKLQEQYNGPTWEVISSVVRQLAAQKLIVPMPEVSFSSSPLPCVRCTFRANEGHFYPLDKSLLFLPKPPMLISYTDISMVVLGRSGTGLGNPRSFDIRIIMRSGSANEYQFSGLPKEDLEAVKGIFEKKGVKITAENEQVKSTSKRYAEGGDDDEDFTGSNDEESSTDEDYNSKDDSEGDSPDEEYNEDYESDTDDSVTDEDEEDEEGEA